MIRRLPLRQRRAADPLPDAEPPVSDPDPAPFGPPPDGTTAPEPSATGQDAVFAWAPEADDPPPTRDAGPSTPAGLEPAAVGVPGPPGFRDRGRLRRRLRYLRRVRELGFRDLGGLAFDLHRFGRDGAGLMSGKLEALEAVDSELRRLEDALDDRRDFVVLREPGIAACPRCAALHGSDANFCPSCGLRLVGPQAMAGIAVGASPGPPATPAHDAGSVRASETGATAVSSGLGPLAAEQTTTVRPAVEPPIPAQPTVEPGAPGHSPGAP